MITINQEVCIGCGKCVSDCFPREIKLVDKKAGTDRSYYWTSRCQLCKNRS